MKERRNKIFYYFIVKMTLLVIHCSSAGAISSSLPGNRGSTINLAFPIPNWPSPIPLDTVLDNM